MKVRLSSRAYDIIKFLCTRLLPASGTLYFALAKIWGFPLAEEVVATITAICTFLGEIMHLSSQTYYEEEQELQEEVVEEEEEELATLKSVPVVYAVGDEYLPEALTEEEIQLEKDLFND